MTEIIDCTSSKVPIVSSKQLSLLCTFPKNRLSPSSPILVITDIS